MIKLAKATSEITITGPIADEGTFTSDLINVPRAMQYDVAVALLMDSGTPTGDITLEIVSVNGANDYLPVDTNSPRIMTIPSSAITASTTIRYAFGVDRVAGILNMKIKLTNDSGISITSGTIYFNKFDY